MYITVMVNILWDFLNFLEDDEFPTVPMIYNNIDCVANLLAGLAVYQVSRS